jgi:hypothetical protein
MLTSGRKPGKNDRVLARFVRAVHADEEAHRVGEPAACVCFLHHRPAASQPLDLGGQAPARLVLPAQDGNEVQELARLFEAWKEALFFGLLVVLLDKSRTIPAAAERAPGAKS